MDSPFHCKICGHPAHPFGTKFGVFLQRTFRFVRCNHCGFISVVDPCVDHALLYNERYYQGKGADPSVDYADELDHPQHTVRFYEWRGIVDLLSDRLGNLERKRWLDYGCGAGGLVRHVNRHTKAECIGFDTGALSARARTAGIPILLQQELNAYSKHFDVITLVEVIEHIADPTEFLSNVATLLRPGGMIFLTTGNARPHTRSFVKWSYVVPEIHISYFTPLSLKLAFEKIGLRTLPGTYGVGWSDIIRFKVLKNLGIKRRSGFEAALPWGIIGRAIDSRLQVTAHPLAMSPC